MFLSRFDPAFSFLRSTAIRQTLILLCVSALITTVAWLATYWMVLRDTNRLVELRLETLIDTTVSTLEAEDSLPQAGPGQYLAMMSSNGIQRGTLPTDMSSVDKRSGFHRLESRKGAGDTDYIVLIRDTPGARLVAVENVERLEETTDILLAGLKLALIVSVLATCIAGFWIAQRNQVRLDRISSGLARVSRGDLDSRINLAGPSDDLRLLADRIDTTTVRLDSAMTQMRVQTANIAHDLRTPLARLRAVLEERHVALIERNEAVSEEVLETALDQIDRIVDTFNALLRIARIESGEQRASFASVDLGELVTTVAEIFGPVVEDQGQTLVVNLNHAVSVNGDANMLVQMIGNLIQNALRYGAEGQQISLFVCGTQLSLIDQGPGIPIDEQDRVLQPLYQLDKQRQSEGYGLGLALVSAICHLHDAQLTLADGPNGQGLKVNVRFPKSTNLSSSGQ